MPNANPQIESLAEIVGAVNAAVAFEAQTFPSSSFPDAVSAADAAAIAAGYRAIGGKWHGLEGCPVEIIAHHIGHDLAYSSRQLIDVSRCHSLAESIVLHADDDCRWLANHSASLDQILTGSYGWTPVSDWTFDIAYVAVGSRNTLFVCFLAED